MKGIKQISFILTILSFLSCGQEQKYPQTISLINHGQNATLGLLEIANYQNQINSNIYTTFLNSSSKRTSWFLDLDEDGIVDAQDEDIDGDNIHNLIDSHPFDRTKGGSDQDGDNIPDFVDFDFETNLQDLKLFGEQQEEIYLKYKIIIVYNKLWTFKDLEKIFMTINLSSNLFSKLHSLKIINLSSKNKLRAAEFNSDWKVISLFNTKLNSTRIDIPASLTHESFHVLMQDYPFLYDQFISYSPWTIISNKYIYNTKDFKKFIFSADDLIYNYYQNINLLKYDICPSLYSLQGPVEHFAEAGLATIFKKRHLEINYPSTRFHNLEKFYTTKMYKLINEFISSQN